MLIIINIIIAKSRGEHIFLHSRTAAAGGGPAVDSGSSGGVGVIENTHHHALLPVGQLSINGAIQ